MNIKAGSILTSTALIDDANFEEATIYISEHNENGTIGFVVNKLFPRTLNQLEEFKYGRAFPLYDGGPVECEKLFFLHQRPDLIEGGKLINSSIYLGGNFKQAVRHINDAKIFENDIKLFIGYCGWDNKQLEKEVEEGSWLINEPSTKSVFNF